MKQSITYTILIAIFITTAFVVNGAIDLKDPAGTEVTQTDWAETKIASTTVPDKNKNVSKGNNGVSYSFTLKTVLEQDGKDLISTTSEAATYDKDWYNQCRQDGGTVSTCHDEVEQYIKNEIADEKAQVKDHLEEQKRKKTGYYSDEFDSSKIDI